MGGLSHTVSGDIASFRTPSRVPIESLKFHFLPRQADGTPSPENPIPIEGWTGLNCGGHGINLWDEEWEIGRINVNNGKNDDNVKTTIRSKNYIPCKPGTKYFIRHPMGTNNFCLFFYDKNKNFISYGWKYSLEVTVPNDCYYLRFYLRNSYGTEYHNDVGINYPSSKTSYVKYTGNKEIPITFPVVGTNIFDISTYPLTANRWIGGNDGQANTSTNDKYKATLDFIPVEQYAGLQLTLNKRPGGSNPGIAFYSSASQSSFISGVKNLDQQAGNPITFAVPTDAKYMRFTVPYSATDIQIERGDTATAYAPYSSDNTFYGGYIDPVAGEIVAEWAKYKCTGNEQLSKWVLDGSSQNIAAKLPYHIFGWAAGDYADYVDGAKNAFCDMENQVTNKQMYFRYTNHGVCVSNGGRITIQVDGITTLDAMSEWLAENKPMIVFKLGVPIHIPIHAEDIKAFLDYNNFWSDANDITEVTYAVTESKDILTTRKKAMDFDHAHHKKVKWNQLAPAISSPAWYAHSSDIETAQFDNGVATLTTIGETDQQYRHTLVTRHASNFWVIGHKYYLRQDVLLDQTGYCICVFGNEWGAQRYVSANVWTTITDAHVTNSTSRNIFGLYPSGSLPIGTVRKVKNIMLFDLTQMFGEGNEPSASKFEHICAINGIDLTTYQPYDTGSDRWLIIP